MDVTSPSPHMGQKPMGEKKKEIRLVWTCGEKEGGLLTQGEPKKKKPPVDLLGRRYEADEGKKKKKQEETTASAEKMTSLFGGKKKGTAPGWT